MKKLFIVLAVASVGFVACNNDSDKKDGTADTAAKVDTTPVVTPPVTDTVPPADTMPKVDTPVKK
jgi:hypothetical protein